MGVKLTAGYSLILSLIQVVEPAMDVYLKKPKQMYVEFTQLHDKHNLSRIRNEVRLYKYSNYTGFVGWSHKVDYLT
ncbi:hypothetical protein [Marinilactibacillus psychrotolerans]|uniref:hypothetical protein n=1 Tax=Marinilactibacillus psychrotolerans TaxID=191770 RepID=UPI003886FC5E